MYQNRFLSHPSVFIILNTTIKLIRKLTLAVDISLALKETTYSYVQFAVILRNNEGS